MQTGDLSLLKRWQLCNHSAVIKQWILLMDTLQVSSVQRDRQKRYLCFCDHEWNSIMDVLPCAEYKLLTDELSLHLCEATHKHLCQCFTVVLNLSHVAR